MTYISAVIGLFTPVLLKIQVPLSELLAIIMGRTEASTTNTLATLDALLRLSLYLHALLELPAACTFCFDPATHYPAPPKSPDMNAADKRVLQSERRWAEEVDPIFNSYGILLLSSGFIAIAAADPLMPGPLSRLIGMPLALYHVGPIKRAYGRIVRDRLAPVDKQGSVPIMKNAKLHLLLHSFVGGMMALGSIGGSITGSTEGLEICSA